MTKVKYRKIEYKNGIKLEPNEYSIVFSDYVIILDKNDKKNTLLFSGLADMKQLKSTTLKNIDNLHGLVNIANLIELDRSIVVEIKNINNLFLDMLTINVLKHMKEPTNIDGLFFRSLELLLTDYYPDVSDLNYQRLVGEERVAGIISKQLTSAVRKYEAKKTTSRAKITLNPYEVIQLIATDSTTVLVDDLNPISLLKQTEDITYTGVGGRNKDTMTRETREIHPNDIGIISESVKDSTDVGISAYLSADPLLDGTTGLSIKNAELTKANIFSPTTLLHPYNEIDD